MSDAEIEAFLDENACPTCGVRARFDLRADGTMRARWPCEHSRWWGDDDIPDSAPAEGEVGS